MNASNGMNDQPRNPLHGVSGKEKKIKEYLDKDIVRNGWTNIIKQVFLPMEKVYKVQNGKKVMREKIPPMTVKIIFISVGKISRFFKDY